MLGSVVVGLNAVRRDESVADKQNGQEATRTTDVTRLDFDWICSRFFFFWFGLVWFRLPCLARFLVVRAFAYLLMFARAIRA